RRIGLVMEVARTSMIHAAAPHFMWPFAVRYATYQLNLRPRVSLPKTSPTLRWTGEVGDASVFRFYHPTSRRVLPSQDVTFDESVPFYHLFPYRSAPPPPPPLFLAPGPPPADPLPPQGPAPLGLSQVDPLPGTAPFEIAVGSGAARGAASRGAASEVRSRGGVEPGGAESEGAESRGAEPQGVASSGGPAGALLRLSLQQLRTHAMALRPSSVPPRVPLPAPPESSLPEVLDPESHRARAASPTVSRLLDIAVTDSSFESTAASALVAELLDFAAACRLDYTTALVADSASASPPSVRGECALGTDVLEDTQEDFECLAAAVPRFASMLLAPEGDPDAPDIPTPRSYAEAITGPYSSQWQAAMDAEMAS
ncbi:unnamed protein product, partial [Closterium sp. NIES-53]